MRLASPRFDVLRDGPGAPRRATDSLVSRGPRGPLGSAVHAVIGDGARGIRTRRRAEVPPDLGGVVELGSRFGTPFYLYDFSVLEERGLALRASLPSRFEICYAVKANPSLAVVALFAGLGLGADVASRGELSLALAAGVRSDRVVCSGPAKSEADLLAAVEHRVLGINVEGPHELDRLQALAVRLEVSIPVQLRLAVPWSAGETRQILGGAGAGKFGVNLALAETLLGQRERWPDLRWQGFQVFNASNVLSAERWVASAARALDLSVELGRRYGVRLDVVDLGGGLGIPYSAREGVFDLETFSRGMEALARACDRIPELSATRLLVEPGRYLVGPAGIYVARVVEVKAAGERTMVTLDGGIHHLLRPALLGEPHPVRLLAGDGRALGRARRVTLAGPLCTSLDVLDAGALLPLPQPGDLAVFLQAGAYGFTESMPLFLTHEWPAELGRRGEVVHALRRSPTVDELRRMQCVPHELVSPAGPT
ncbi:MAG: hypothetical protein ABI609_11050 [Acidobacteriota bacterium]